MVHWDCQVNLKFGLCLKLRLIKIYLLRPLYIVFHANKKKLHSIGSKSFESEFNLENEFNKQIEYKNLLKMLKS